MFVKSILLAKIIKNKVFLFIFAPLVYNIATSSLA